MDRKAWWATVYGITRVGHDIAAEQQRNNSGESIWVFLRPWVMWPQTFGAQRSTFLTQSCFLWHLLLLHPLFCFHDDWGPISQSDHGCLLTFVLVSIKCWMNPRQRSPSPPLFPVILLSVACVCFLGMQCFNPKFCSKLRDFSPHGRPGAEVCVRVAI